MPTCSAHQHESCARPSRVEGSPYLAPWVQIQDSGDAPPRVGSSLLERDERQKPRPWLGALPFRPRKSQGHSDVDLADARQDRGQSCGAEPRDAYSSTNAAVRATERWLGPANEQAADEQERQS